MSDPIKVVRQLLLADAGVSALASTHIFAGALPANYNPETPTSVPTPGTGPACVISVKGGQTNSEMPLQSVSLQVTCWAGVNGFLAARSLYSAVFAALHGKQNLDFGDDGKLVSCIETAVGQDVTDPDAGWATVINAFTVMITGGVSLTSDIEANETVKQYVDDSIAAAIAGVATLPIAESDVTGLTTDLATLAAAIVSETNRAESVEGGIEADLATEVSRAEAAETLLLPIANPSATGVATVDQDALGANNTNNVDSVATLIIDNATAATSSIPQNPGTIQLKGSYWNTVTLASVRQKVVDIFAGWASPLSASLLFIFGGPTGPAGINHFAGARNNTPATSSQNEVAPALVTQGFFWNGTASIRETWEWLHSFASGSNPTSTLKAVHSGSSGQATLDLAGGGTSTAIKVLVPTPAVDTNTTDAASTAFVLAQAAAATPLSDGSAAVGTSTRFARADHVHPSDSSREATANKDVASGYAGLTSGVLLKSAEFPAPTSSTFGGIKALAAVAKKYLTSIGTDGIPVAVQPASTDLSDLPVPISSGGTGQIQAGQYGVMIARSFVDVAQSTQAEAVVYTVTIPAGLMTANGIVKFSFFGKLGTVTGSCTLRVRIGASGSGTAGTALTTIASAVSSVNMAGEITIGNRNSLSSQLSGVVARLINGVINDANTATAINTANAWEINITLQMANADASGIHFNGACAVVFP